MTSLLRLEEHINQQILRPVTPAIKALSEYLLTTYEKRIAAILFYGSCLRTGNDRGGMVDLYVLVDRYHAFESRRLLATLNKWLPPNVYYLEVPFENRRVRAKYAVLSLSDFESGASNRWFHSYIWARFAQPVGLLYARDEQVVQRVQSALAQAVTTFISRVLPQVSSPFTAVDLWRKGLELSYRAELRAERPEKLVRLLAATPDYYEHVTRSSLKSMPLAVASQNGDATVIYAFTVPDRVRWKSGFDWWVRRWQGKVLSVLRLLKGLLTFRGGVDYILWKIERHSGVKVEVSAPLKRYPLIATCVILWKLYMRGAYR
jgi:hypothetical protein